MKTFKQLGLNPSLCKALDSCGYSEPTPIQEQAVPHLIKGKDLLGCAQTGTGKTASFALPILQRLSETKRTTKKRQVLALILTPTRELAVQVADSFKKYGKELDLKSTVIYGGVRYNQQIKALKNGVDIIIATPGRLLDLFRDGYIDFSSCRHLILDEADRMLDMGFKNDLETITSHLPEERQTILFSATMPTSISKLASKILSNPIEVKLSSQKITAANIDEEVRFVTSESKLEALIELLQDRNFKRTIVFTRTKHVAQKLSKTLEKRGIRNEAIHGDKHQNARQKSLKNFKNDKVKVLVATDVAARGIDIDTITHVINYQLSNEIENYVHRIGRTARAGEKGKAIILCDAEDLKYLVAVEKYLKRAITVFSNSDYHSQKIEKKYFQLLAPQKKEKKSKSSNKNKKPSRNSAKNTKPIKAKTERKPKAETKRRSKTDSNNQKSKQKNTPKNSEKISNKSRPKRSNANASKDQKSRGQKAKNRLAKNRRKSH